MQCDCCGKKKKLFESYALVQTKYGSLNLCVKCNDIAYKVRDDANDMNIDEFQNHIDEWEKRSKKPSEKFLIIYVLSRRVSSAFLMKGKSNEQNNQEHNRLHQRRQRNNQRISYITT